MTDGTPLHLSRRERQIMEILYRLGEVSAADVREALPDPPSYSAVRAALRLLVEKGHARHRKDGRRYVYTPTVAPAQARRSAVRALLATFFEGSVEKAVASLLAEASPGDLDEEEYRRLQRLIDDARRKGDEA